MNPIIAVIREHLRSENLALMESDDPDVVVAVLNTSLCRYLISFNHLPSQKRLEVHGLYPISVPAERRSVVAEFLTRINWGIKAGAFQMDWSDGELRFLRVCWVEGEPTRDKVGEWVVAVCVAFDGFHRALMSLIYRQASADHAVEQGQAEFLRLVAQVTRPGEEPGNPE